MKRKYDLIFGLGAACHNSILLRSCGLQLNSYPFDWLFGSDFGGRMGILLSQFKRFIELGDLEYAHSERSIKCDAYHNKYNDLTFNHDFPAGIDVAVSYKCVNDKYRRRIHRLLNQICESKKVLIVYSEVPSQPENLSNAQIKKFLEPIQAKWPQCQIDLLYIASDINMPHGNYKVVADTNDFIKIVANYQNASIGAESWMVDNSVLKKIICRRYTLNMPIKKRMKILALRYCIKIIPCHNIRHKLYQKYHIT